MDVYKVALGLPYNGKQGTASHNRKITSPPLLWYGRCEHVVSAPTTGSSLKYSESQMSDRYLKDAFAFDVQWQPYLAGVVTALSTMEGG